MAISKRKQVVKLLCYLHHFRHECRALVFIHPPGDAAERSGQAMATQSPDPPLRICQAESPAPVPRPSALSDWCKASAA